MIVVCNGVAMKLRLVVQACGCCTVRGGDGVKDHDPGPGPDPVHPEQRRGHVGWRVPAATTTHLHLHLLWSATAPPSSSDWWGKLAAGVRCEAEAESRCVLVAGPDVEDQS